MYLHAIKKKNENICLNNKIKLLSKKVHKSFIFAYFLEPSISERSQEATLLDIH